MSQTITYEASVYTRLVTYKNFKGETQTTSLYFALDPLQLMQVIAGVNPRKSKSANPAKRGQELEMTDDEQLKLVRSLAVKSAGFPSENGETWEPFEDFENTIAGKAFLTKLVASDGDRKEFSEKVILAPFRAFVGFAESDDSNSPAEIQQLKTMLTQMENIFAGKTEPETIDERRARLARELDLLSEGEGA